ncbi:acetylxylan esterase [Membranicola marinus]|uniref:Acetylxylan esterase n=1 Tax=Membranihabitans marinus TaxID=1227546 RepID=A0A953HQF1_9BACT|nr:acetylxylan esterase [Membranihabitans marinus]MBY5959344.1 acetylxylan esterase [Membranihabitans marinus]
MKPKFYLFLLLVLPFVTHVDAQPRKQLVQVIVSPDHDDWTYEVGDQAEFTITALKNNVPLQGIEVKYTVQPDPGYRTMELLDEGSFILKQESVKIKTEKFDRPGFLRFTASVEVDGKKYAAYATAGFSPEKIEPTTTLPADFESFWSKGKEDLAKVPVNPVLTLMPERSTANVNVYHVRLDNIDGKIYGILCTPKKEGKYPAILHVPGAGIRPYYGVVSDAEQGFISFTIGIHGIPVNLDKSVYDNLMQGPLKNYMTINLDDKDHAFYKRVYLGCVRAVDFIEGLDNFDGENIGVTGGSQGGALSIVTAGLDDRISYLAAFYPALSDLTGFLHHRAGGWPQLFTDEFTNKPEKIETSKYFDVVNFARFVKVPGFYSWGYNDNVCPPTSMYAAYNVLPAEKELHVFPETHHWAFPEQHQLKNKWLFEKLKN